jgi:hypothetical protein
VSPKHIRDAVAAVGLALDDEAISYLEAEYVLLAIAGFR